jgi:hypothetical protein
MNQLSKMSYNYIKSVKDKENKILSYYKKINSIEQPKILAIPKRKKNTKKNLDNIKKLYENNELLISKEDENKKEDEKKLTKKRVVDMGD